MKKIVCALMVAGVMSLAMVGCGKDGVVETPSEPTETGEVATPSTQPTEDRWEDNSNKGTEPSEEPTETEEPTVTVDPVENETPSIVTEDDLVHVVVPEINQGIIENMYNELATYRVEGSEVINESIDYGITLESPSIKRLISLIYEGTGCTSHKVLEETYAVFDSDPYDYSAYIELSSGAKYGLYLVGEMCYALEDNS